MKYIKKGRERNDENLGSPQGCGRGKENPAKVLAEGSVQHQGGEVTLW